MVDMSVPNHPIRNITEPALTCIYYDILGTVDEKRCVILLSVDFGAAFDTTEHDMWHVTVNAVEIL